MEDDLVLKTINWYRESSDAITEAGGRPDYIISRIPDDVLITLVRNNLVLTYRKIPV